MDWTTSLRLALCVMSGFTFAVFMTRVVLLRKVPRQQLRVRSAVAAYSGATMFVQITSLDTPLTYRTGVVAASVVFGLFVTLDINRRP